MDETKLFRGKTIGILSRSTAAVANDHMIVTSASYSERSGLLEIDLYCLLTACTVDGQLFHWAFATASNFVQILHLKESTRNQSESRESPHGSSS